MTERIADVRRRLHEALDSLDERDASITRLRHDLEAAGRRLAEEVARRRSAESRLAAVEAELARGPVDMRAELSGRATVEWCVRHAAADLVVAAAVVLKALWRRVPEPVRARLWAVRRRVVRR